MCCSATAPSPRRSRSPSPRSRSRSRSGEPGAARHSGAAWRVRLDELLAGTTLEPSVYAELGALGAQEQTAVLDRLAEANLAAIKNPGSFLQGIVRRVAAEGSADLTQCLDMLSRPLRDAFTRLLDAGRLRKGDLESRVATQLRVRAAPRRVACRAAP